jgi:hypothetical protein
VDATRTATTREPSPAAAVSLSAGRGIGRR